MFEQNKPIRSEISEDIIPKQIQLELWNMIFRRQQKGMTLVSPQRFNFFKDPVHQTLSVVHSQAEPAFSDNVTAPYIPEFANINFPSRVYIHDMGNEMVLKLD
ncbi:MULTISPECIES: DUF960 family protein [Enterococcus]|uniref:Uncharacterized protein n=1 Tax=Enterococcus alishanensis TaxID=1303817 RepID=A0ABS6TD56_9ENTE|nr:DUF960 family protein [Enterococcus alishanensis]MBV7390827.1 hypothetical protein [Enterococcus alishanensis]